MKIIGSVHYSLEGGARFSFAKVEYEDIAEFVGLDADGALEDIETFELSRVRIPTSLFRSILEDMDIVMRQYGPNFQHPNVEATSRYMAPVRTSQFSTLRSTQALVFRSLIT